MGPGDERPISAGSCSGLESRAMTLSEVGSLWGHFGPKGPVWNAAPARQTAQLLVLLEDFFRHEPRSSPGGPAVNPLILLGFVLGTLVASLSPRLRRRAQYLGEGVVRQTRVAPCRLRTEVSDERLEVTLGAPPHQAPVGARLRLRWEARARIFWAETRTALDPFAGSRAAWRIARRRLPRRPRVLPSGAAAALRTRGRRGCRAAARRSRAPARRCG